MNLAEIMQKTRNSEIDLNDALNEAYKLGRDENEIEIMTKELLELSNNNFVFVEYYTHTNCDCYKILNPYTNYREDKQVLCKVSEGLKLALKTAIKSLETEKNKYYDKSKK